MGLKYDILDGVMGVFYEFPGQAFTVRKLSRKTKIPKSTIQKYLKELRATGLITKDSLAGDSRLFKIKKINYYIEKITGSGLIDYLVKELNPSCIILFGSFRKGESVAESDIDLFVETQKKGDLDLKRFERILKHNIQLFIEEDINKLQPRLLNNVVNGIKLDGSFRIR